jgi:hypothetical protein
MSDELIKAMEWLMWQLGMMYTVDEHSSRYIEIYGSESHAVIEYRWQEFIQVVISYQSDDDEYNKEKIKLERWEIKEDEENEDLLMIEMESILNYVRNNM